MSTPSHRLSKFDFRTHALAHHAEHLLPILGEIDEGAPNTLEELVDLVERDMPSLLELLDKVGGVSEDEEVTAAVEAMRKPENFEVSPPKVTRRVARKTDEIRARVENQLAENFRVKAEGRGMSESEALREAVRDWCEKQ